MSSYRLWIAVVWWVEQAFKSEIGGLILVSSYHMAMMVGNFHSVKKNILKILQMELSSI